MELKSRNAPIEKNELPVMGMIQWIEGRADHPNENRQTGIKKAPDEGGHESVLRFDVAIFVKQGLHVLADVPEVGGIGREGADQNLEKGEALRPKGEVVDAEEDDGKDSNQR
jgi:hypothetical protein